VITKVFASMPRRFRHRGADQRIDDAGRRYVSHLKREPRPKKGMQPAEIIDKTNYKAWLVPVYQRSRPGMARGGALSYSEQR
jgi:hypothetical protein